MVAHQILGPRQHEGHVHLRARLLRAVDSQQDLCRKDAHRQPPLVSATLVRPSLLPSVEQPEQVGYGDQHAENRQAEEDAQPELFKHPGCAFSSSVRLYLTASLVQMPTAPGSPPGRARSPTG